MVQINLRVRESVAQALRKVALGETGQMRGMSEIGEKALVEYLTNKYGIEGL